MSTIQFNDQAAMNSLISEEFGPWSKSFVVDQQLIDDFARLSGDDYWIHTDPERAAKESPFGSTIAHGFLILVCLSRFERDDDMLGNIAGYSFMNNYGSNKLRFLDPVPVNSEIHSRSRIKAVEVGEKGTKLTLEQVVHVVGNERPALVYELIMFMF